MATKEFWSFGAIFASIKSLGNVLAVGISSGQRNLMKTYHNDANTGGITKIASKKVLKVFRQSGWN